MEFHGSPIPPVWVNVRGVPAHTWNEEAFSLLGNCLGRTVRVDRKISQKEDLEVGRVKVILDRSMSLPSFMFLWVEDLIFKVEIGRESGFVQGFGVDLSAASKGGFLSGAMGRARGTSRMAREEEVDDVSDDVGAGDSNFESPSGWRKLFSLDSDQIVG